MTRPRRPAPDHEHPPAVASGPPARRGPDRNARRFRAPLLWGLAASVLLHGLLLLGWRTDIAVPGASGAVPRDPGAPSPGGSASMRAVETRVRTSRVPPPPPPVAEPAAPDIAEVELALEDAPAAVSRRPGGPSREPGAGGEPGPPVPGSAGAGPPAFVPPAPRSILPAWDPPEAARGREVTVRVRVDARGRPTRPVEVRPSTGDEDFDRRLVRKVLRMDFEPARRGGEPVAAWAELTFVF